MGKNNRIYDIDIQEHKIKNRIVRTARQRLYGFIHRNGIEEPDRSEWIKFFDEYVVERIMGDEFARAI